MKSTLEKIKKPILIFLIILPLLFLAKISIGISSGYEHDGKWWYCYGYIEKRGWVGCIKEPIGLLFLDKEELNFVNTLNKLPTPPEKTTPETNIKIIGKQPDLKVVSNIYYGNIGPNSGKNRGLTVYVYNQRIFRIDWFEQYKFSLIKAYHLQK